MKLLDENGKFQFVRNGLVQVDKTLPKYKITEILKEARKNKVTTIVNTNEPHIVTDGNGTQTQVLIPETRINETGEPERSITANLDNIDHLVSATDWEEKRDVDKQLREIVLELQANDLRKYLNQMDANEFNLRFSKFLKAEHKGYFGVSLNNTVGINQSRFDSYFKNDGRKPTLIDKITSYFNKRNKSQEEKDDEKKAEDDALHVIDFFDMIHVETGKEKEFIDRIDGFFSLIRNAANMHQDAQLDELCQNLVLNIYESVLAVNGFNKYITFQEIEKMKADGKRMVDIDYIQNFGRIIPNEVVEKKMKCDGFGVFDNYCVMYYDPSGETYKMTMEAKRDPILFGLINHSEKLYYIADWVDDKCDLTLEKVAELCTVEEIKEAPKAL